MNPEQTISRFYKSFAEKDYNAMNSLYHSQATFYDPVFHDLSVNQTRAMWHMLCLNGKDLEIKAERVAGFDNNAAVVWHAFYSFSRTGRHVHNIVSAKFVFKDGLIFRHEDRFDLWRWSRMALGVNGLLLGWTKPVQNKIHKLARYNLEKFMEAHPEYRSSL